MNQNDQKKQMAKFLQEGHMHYINDVLHRPASQAEYSSWLGISPNTLTRLINGLSLPSLDNLVQIANRLGPEAYDICGIPRLAPSDPKFQIFLEKWNGLTAKEQHRLIDNLNQIIEERERLPNGLQAST